MKPPARERPPPGTPAPGRQVPAPDPQQDRKRALALTPVSRETAARLDRFVALLLDWQSTTQLIARASVPQLWTRHISDSLQLLDIVPTARTWIDLGSGAGFPGLVLACALADAEGACVHLVESNAKKAAFLHEAIRVTGAPARVNAQRIEDFGRVFAGRADAVTGRALAPLRVLFEHSVALVQKTGAVGLFPKGQHLEEEIIDATTYWKFQAERRPSLTSAKGSILVVRALERRASAPE